MIDDILGKKKNGVEIMRDLYYSIKKKQKPTPELNESVKHRRPLNKPDHSLPENKAPEKKIARKKQPNDLDL